MASRRRQRGFASQAALESVVRFGPELSGLKALLQAAQENRDTSIAQAHGQRRAVHNEIDQAVPRVGQIYDSAGLAQARTAHTLIGGDLSGLGAGADAFKAGAATEQAGFANRLQNEQTQVLTDLAGRKVSAREGEGFAVKNARREYAGEAGKILQRGVDLAREQGAFESATIDKLAGEQANRDVSLTKAGLSARQQERDSLRSAGIDPDTGEPIKGGKLDPKAHSRGGGGRDGGATREDHEQALSTLSSAVSALKTLDPERDRSNWKDLGDLLQRGAKSKPIYTTDVSGKRVPRLTKSGTQLETPEVPKVPNLWARVALEVYYNGHLSAQTQRRLHSLGYSVKTLGLPSYGEYRQGAGSPAGKIGASAQNVVQLLAGALGLG